MSLAFSNPTFQNLIQAHNAKARILDITGDTSYPSNGYSITARRLGFNRIFGAQFLGFNGPTPAGLSSLAWDYANNKLIVLSNGRSPALVVEEIVTITANAGRISRIPGYIIAIQSVGGTAGACRVIPVGTTPATLQVAVNFVTGAVATFTTDAVTSLKVTYIPLGVGQFTEANRVVDEAVVFGSGAGDTFNLANRAAVIQYIWNSTDSVHLPPIQPVGEAPAADEITIDINNSAATTITHNAANDTNLGKATYFKYSASWLADHSWTDDADITITSTTLFSVADDLAVPPQGIWIPGFGVILVGEATATNKNAVFQGPQGTAGANVALYDPIKGNVALTGADAYTTFAVPYVFVSSDQNVGASGQVQTGSNLSSMSARMMFWGI